MSYSETLMDHFSSPRNMRPLADPDRVGTAGAPGRGPYVVLYLKLAAGRVVAAGFASHGCGATIAAGSALTELILGRTVESCRALAVADLVEALDGVPPTKLHSPDLAIAALRAALPPGPPADPVISR